MLTDCEYVCAYADFVSMYVCMHACMHACGALEASAVLVSVCLATSTCCAKQSWRAHICLLYFSHHACLVLYPPVLLSPAAFKLAPSIAVVGLCSPHDCCCVCLKAGCWVDGQAGGQNMMVCAIALLCAAPQTQHSEQGTVVTAFLTYCAGGLHQVRVSHTSLPVFSSWISHSGLFYKCAGACWPCQRP
jgi:hypothetical protein